MLTADGTYRLVFDATDKIFQRVPLAIGFVVVVLAGVAIGTLIAVRAIRTGAHRRPLPATAVIALLLMLVIVLGGSLAVVASTASDALDRDQTERAVEASPVVEGVVENFHPMPQGGHDTDRFDVSGVHFEYGSAGMSQGFNQDVTVGGPIRAGLYVRIHYVSVGARHDNVIVRREIRQ